MQTLLVRYLILSPLFVFFPCEEYGGHWYFANTTLTDYSLRHRRIFSYAYRNVLIRRYLSKKPKSLKLSMQSSLGRILEEIKRITDWETFLISSSTWCECNYSIISEKIILQNFHFRTFSGRTSLASSIFQLPVASLW